MNQASIRGIVDRALKEDTGQGDITTEILVAPNQTSEGYIILKEKAVVCGLAVVAQVFKELDRNIRLKTAYQDGDMVKANTKIIRLQGKTRAILSGERVALNFLSHLSGIAQKTRAFVQAVHPYRVKIFDTRKTTPGLRLLEKYAVRCGGGYNHRFSLSDMIFIKDNHLAACQEERTIKKIIAQAKTASSKELIVEVNNLKQFKEAFAAHPNIILLDNMSLKIMRQAVRLAHSISGKHRPQLEASGGITIKNVRQVAQTGVDRISIGELTHTHKAVNMSLEITA